MSRSLSKVFKAVSVSDGAGVKLKRSIGAVIDSLDPFLLLDEFKSDQRDDYIAGFPEHPHRGFETVTYMLAGRMEHRDHKGNTGNLVAGSVQWMTAGRGIVHSEMPKQEDGLMWGFQLWVNLPAKDKMVPPRYQDIPPENIPEVLQDNVKIKVIAGEVNGVKGAVSGIATQPTYLDVSLPPSSRFYHPLPASHNAFCYVFEGEGDFGSTPRQHLTIHTLGVFGSGDYVEAFTGTSPCRFILVSGAPLGEPVARQGPFVMNTRQELMQAFRDYQDGTLQQ